MIPYSLKERQISRVCSFARTGYRLQVSQIMKMKPRFTLYIKTMKSVLNLWSLGNIWMMKFELKLQTEYCWMIRFGYSQQLVWVQCFIILHCQSCCSFYSFINYQPNQSNEKNGYIMGQSENNKNLSMDFYQVIILTTPLLLFSFAVYHY